MNKRSGKSKYAQKRACIRKVRFTRKRTAQRRAKELGMHAYQCEHCDGWHLSSLPGKRPGPGR